MIGCGRGIFGKAAAELAVAPEPAQRRLYVAIKAVARAR
jgi:hypothetical protein